MERSSAWLSLLLIGVIDSFLWAQSNVQAQLPTEFKSHAELMQHMALKRAGLVSYVMELDAEWDTQYNQLCRSCSFYIEFSQVGTHYLVLRNERIEDSYRKGLHWGGQSGDQMIYEVATAGTSLIGMRRIDRFEKPWIPEHVDWRAVGLGFCGDFPDRTFEEISGSIAEWDAEFPIPVIDGIARFDDNPTRLHQAKYQIDLRQGSTPILFDFTPGAKPSGYSRWKVDVARFEGFYLPKSATLECDGNTLNLKFRWLLVNEPLEGGKAACERLARKFNLSLAESAR